MKMNTASTLSLLLLLVAAGCADAQSKGCEGLVLRLIAWYSPLGFAQVVHRSVHRRLHGR
jgi:hypothetical protein